MLEIFRAHVSLYQSILYYSTEKCIIDFFILTKYLFYLIINNNEQQILIKI